MRLLSKHLTGGSQVDGAGLFSVLPSDRTRGNGHKLIRRKVHMSMREIVITVRATEH